MNHRIQTVATSVRSVPQLRSLAVIGDPGCDGLGTYNMKVYASALKESAPDSAVLVVGDLVPTGKERYYDTICTLTNEIAENDVYVLRGNHDTGFYEDYFGRKNYALAGDGFTVIVLDNALRRFEEEGLALLREVLADPNTKQAIIAFHIPVPNHFIKNAVSEEEFARLQEAYRPWQEKVRYLLCGHVHSRFEDVVDGIPLVCTGGGGALIEDVSQDIRACDVEHHIVHFFLENGVLRHRFADLSEGRYETERREPILRERLEEAVQGELMAHLRYLTAADRAERRGFTEAANLFRALAASEYHHARNFYAILESPGRFSDTAQRLLPGEQFEYQYSYRMMQDYSAEKNLPLAEQAYRGAAAAEKVHAQLLSEAVRPEQVPRETLYVCPICGYVMTGESAPDRCPVCGGPSAQFEIYSVHSCAASSAAKCE